MERLCPGLACTHVQNHNCTAFTRNRHGRLTVIVFNDNAAKAEKRPITILFHIGTLISIFVRNIRMDFSTSYIILYYIGTYVYSNSFNVGLPGALRDFPPGCYVIVFTLVIPHHRHTEYCASASLVRRITS